MSSGEIYLFVYLLLKGKICEKRAVEFSISFILIFV